MSDFSSFKKLNQCVVGCHLCPRLVRYRELVPSRAAFAEEEHWRRPVPGFGDPKAWLVLIGLAPSAQGANRTGRIFTGDGSARFLIKALHKAGFANQPTSESADDGLKLLDCYMTPAVKCVPPKNRPLPSEIAHCTPYLQAELALLKEATTLLALGKIAFDQLLSFAKNQGCDTKGMRFEHGRRYHLEGFFDLYASYHPSPQNTQTGKLTEAMMLNLLAELKR